ncbi:hypothetical protein B9G53_25820 [Pseudanabaena sp. SR411]|jgi:hypothetical protein|uniref:hypothetical protein n=1 Tax=Pseudanabaena sp. SR411 TaxID=1980935 RepID=UPI000B989C47|nr:hypothetical protein [Pseudanabaena sp. SR411]OYQ61705.1 hypothetical protein B9G53_25820 [Pseudanabaena sp. SR411]
MSRQVNCQEECTNGCVLGDKCPHLEYLAKARKLLAETSIDKLIEISDSRFLPPDAPTTK